MALAVAAAAERALIAYHGDTPLKRPPLRGLREEVLPFDRYVDLMPREAAPKRPATIAGWPPEC